MISFQCHYRYKLEAVQSRTIGIQTDQGETEDDTEPPEPPESNSTRLQAAQDEIEGLKLEKKVRKKYELLITHIEYLLLTMGRP